MAMRFETARSARPPHRRTARPAAGFPPLVSPTAANPRAGAGTFSMRPVPQSAQQIPQRSRRCSPSGFARKWRRKGLKRFNPRPEMVWPRKPRTPNIWYSSATRTHRAHSRRRRARRMLRAGEGEGNFPGCKALKSHEMRKGSHRVALGTTHLEAGDEDSSASPRLPGNRRPGASDASPPRPERSSSRPAQGPGECGRREEGEEKVSIPRQSRGL